MTVPMLDPARGNSSQIEELLAAASRVIRSGKYILGPEVENFEKACAAYLKVPHAIGVSSGTDALIAALLALGIGPGDEVIVPAFTFIATAEAVCRVGAKPVFADILPDCFTMDPNSFSRAITDRAKAVIPVHLFGQSSAMDPILRVASAAGLCVVEDCAQAIGARHSGHMVGSIGDIGCFSFFPSKNLGGFGDAGLVTTRNDDLAEAIISVRNHGSAAVYRHNRIGGNFRIDALQAALLLVKLESLQDATLARFKHAQMYNTFLAKTRYVTPPTVRHTVHNQYTIRVPDGKRDALQEYLKNHGIASAVYYPVPLHRQECFANIVESTISCPESERAALECLSIPIAAELTDAEIEFVIQSLLEFNAKELDVHPS